MSRGERGQSGISRGTLLTHGAAQPPLGSPKHRFCCVPWFIPTLPKVTNGGDLIACESCWVGLVVGGRPALERGSTAPISSSARYLIFPTLVYV